MIFVPLICLIITLIAFWIHRLVSPVSSQEPLYIVCFWITWILGSVAYLWTTVMLFCFGENNEFFALSFRLTLLLISASFLSNFAEQILGRISQKIAKRQHNYAKELRNPTESTRPDPRSSKLYDPELENNPSKLTPVTT